MLKHAQYYSRIYMRKFYCYSVRLKNALIANGFTPISYGVNPSSGAPYWVFEGTEQMNDYKNNKYQLERDLYWGDNRRSGQISASTYRQMNCKEETINGT